MTYIFLVAGKGTRLHPLTLEYPKTLFKLDDNVSVLQRMVTLIKQYDKKAEIVVVTGFMDDKIRKSICNVNFVYNPFYSITNSITSLWFASEYLEKSENVVIINGDIVMEEILIERVLTIPTDKPLVFLDSSIKKNGDYNVQVNGEEVVVMSKGLDNYCGEYAGVVKLDSKSIKQYIKEMNYMVNSAQHDQWFEDVLVNMIFKNNFKLYYSDISEYSWTEIDCVDDLAVAKRIQQESEYFKKIGLEE